MLLLFSISTPAIFHLYWSNVLNLLLELVGLAPCKLQIANPMLPNLILPTENFPTPFHFFKDSGQIFNTVSNTSHVQFLPLADLPGRLSCTPPSPPGSSLFSRESWSFHIALLPWTTSHHSYDGSVRSQFGHHVLKAASVFFFLSSIYNLQCIFGL